MPRAGLDAASVTEAGAALADEIGFTQLSMNVLAERLGVKTPSLYKHVAGLADLQHRIAVLATTEAGTAMRDATQDRVGREALNGAAHALRNYVKAHPGRYAATAGVRPTGPEDPLVAARERAFACLAAVLHGYRLSDADRIHALRMLRSVLHGFATLEAADDFQLGTAIDDSFGWVVDFLDGWLRATAAGAPRDCRSAAPHRSLSAVGW